MLEGLYLPAGLGAAGGSTGGLGESSKREGSRTIFKGQLEKEDLSL